MPSVPAEPLFVFGTLLDAEVLGEVLGESRAAGEAKLQGRTSPVRTRSAHLAGYSAVVLTGQHYPVLRQSPGDRVPGQLLDGLTREHWRRLVWFEGSQYDVDHCRIDVGTTTIDARVFASENRTLTTDAPWRLDHWQKTHKADYLVRARLWMRQLDAVDSLPDDVVWLTPLDTLRSQGLLETR